MNVAFHSPVLFVKNIRVSRLFYEDLLDQEVDFDFGTSIVFKSRLSLWQPSPEHEVTPLLNVQPGRNSFEIYFETEDIEEIAGLLKSRDVELFHDIKTESWGQQTIRFFDPDHHFLEVGEAMHVFVSRIYNETGSIEATATITGITAGLIESMLI